MGKLMKNYCIDCGKKCYGKRCFDCFALFQNRPEVKKAKSEEFWERYSKPNPDKKLLTNLDTRFQYFQLKYGVVK